MPIVLLGILFMIFPDASSAERCSWLLGDQFGIYRNTCGRCFLLLSVYVAFSKIRPNRSWWRERPVKSDIPTLNGIVMIFTSTMAANIVFYAMIEWAYTHKNLILENSVACENGVHIPIIPLGPIAWASTSCLRWPLVYVA